MFLKYTSCLNKIVNRSIPIINDLINESHLINELINDILNKLYQKD